MEGPATRVTRSQPLRGSAPRSRRVVFDVGGVLVKTDREHFRRAIESLAGMEVDSRHCAAFLDSALVRSYECGRMPDADFLSSLRSWFRLPRVSDSRVRAVWCSILTGPTDLCPFLAELPDDAWLVASNTNPMHWQRLLESHLPQMVDTRAALSFRIGSTKPGTRFFRAMLGHFAAEDSPSSILFVDDRSENVEAAAAVGMHAVLVRSTEPTAARRRVREWLE